MIFFTRYISLFSYAGICCETVQSYSDSFRKMPTWFFYFLLKKRMQKVNEISARVASGAIGQVCLSQCHLTMNNLDFLTAQLSPSWEPWHTPVVRMRFHPRVFFLSFSSRKLGMTQTGIGKEFLLVSVWEKLGLILRPQRFWENLPWLGWAGPATRDSMGRWG